MAVEHTCSAGKTDRLKRRWRLGGQGTSSRQKGVRVRGQLKRTLKLICCALFPGSATADYLTSGLTEIVIGPMIYVLLSTRSNILLLDCSQMALNIIDRSKGKYVKCLNSSIQATVKIIVQNTRTETPVFKEKSEHT